MGSTAAHVPIPRNGVDYRGKVVLAPMVRSGELPSRLLALQYGADLVWGPETVDKSMIGTTKRNNPVTSTIDYTRLPSNKNPHIAEGARKESIIYSIHPEREKGRLIFQIGTSSPTTAVEAARLVAPHVAGIDVNAGCPKPFSTSSGMGAALLQTPDLLVSILTALVKEVGQVYEIGISVKIRLLAASEDTETLVKRLCATGITGLTVHCRTTPMRPRERAIRAQLRMIAGVCRGAGVACVMNGDVKDRDEAVQLMEEYGVDGAMIATAAEKNSSCFRSGTEGGLVPWRQVVDSYMRTAISVGNRYGNTKFLLAQLIPGKAEEQRKVTASKSYRQACLALGMDDEVVDLGKELDERLGIDEYKLNHNNNNNNNNKSKAAKKANQTNKSAQAAGGNMTAQRDMERSRHSPLSERGVGGMAVAKPALAV